MVSEVESSYSKKWEVGSAELKANGLGFIRASSALGPQSALKPACGDGGNPPFPRPPVATQSKKKALPQKAGANTLLAIRARYHLQIWRKYLKILSLRFYLPLMDR